MHATLSLIPLRADNIDYDDIKLYIKEQTTPGKGKTISVPGRNDEKLQHFEHALFITLQDQHHRIDLFVKSKAGEIQRRLRHSERQLQQLSSRVTTSADQRIPVGRLERYGRLENDVIKAGDEIKSLARFTSTQRTAFRKLLKKYKKWTGSTSLEDRFREEVLDDPKSFTKLDLGPLLDEYSTTLQQIRTLYETRIQQKSAAPKKDDQPMAGSSTISRLQAAMNSGSKTELDTAIATVPLGENGTFASYLVHPENVVELQVLLLQHSRYFLARSRSNSITSPVSLSPKDDVFNQTTDEGADYFAIEADEAERLAKEQNGLTVDQREHSIGSTPQKARVCVRWASDEEAQVAYRKPNNQCQYAEMKKKAVTALFDPSSAFSAIKSAMKPDSEQALTAIRREVQQDSGLKPLHKYSCCRTRLVGTENSDQKHMLATLDTQIVIQQTGDSSSKSSFPFAVLLVRQEGAYHAGLLTALDQSHLVERVRGFSLEYHAIWLTSKSAEIPAPLWLPMLERDIRKLPPPAMKRTSSSAIQTPASRDSANNITDSTTAVETTRSDSITQQSELEVPPLRSFRKKRRRNLPEATAHQETRYWSEYDHPEEPEDGDSSGYAIYIDPNEKSGFDEFFDRLGRLFKRKRPAEEEPMLSGQTSPKDDETSDDDDEVVTVKPRQKSYGTLGLSTSRNASGRSQHRSDLEAQTQTNVTSIAHIRSVCYIASLVILLVALMLATTGRHKLRYEVNVGVIFAISSSLFFAIAGFATLLRQQDVSYTAWAVGILVLVIDAIGSGGLLAWMLG
ncbi:hypothetical protein LTR78_001930 [Recurvomyces mirabilis]|uniref:SPX domain-containing protein n=1 Tax=Recurvomyces mirabilis TaxID=574656 RepID=A0AAE1C5B1_9PEZI|nr:hypothetical protein LTR78_001930 [Recurvomyces mirabilis]KAK5156631.1 hypothetical protein LTS14_004843 [Recurvomyces mirabilis]